MSQLENQVLSFTQMRLKETKELNQQIKDMKNNVLSNVRQKYEDTKLTRDEYRLLGHLLKKLDDHAVKGIIMRSHEQSRKISSKKSQKSKKYIGNIFHDFNKYVSYVKNYGEEMMLLDYPETGNDFARYFYGKPGDLDLNAPHSILAK